eukprot:TRINITY_DN8635_c0_g1_i1.p1 TRINITY_DN8635_c0_g1~~TRINITY_DN8635_c0_g1_i1.p1  ORF type:complete len:284 (+),score=23.26 TRINITY_DN8635_c0_g1_i1:37-888(+)
MTTDSNNEEEDDKGLSRFQELWVSVCVTVFFFILLIQVLYRSKLRQAKLHMVTRNSKLDVYDERKCKQGQRRNEIAKASVKLFSDFTPYIPYTGREVSGMVCMGDTESDKHPKNEKWVDFREYARWVSYAIRQEVQSLACEGVLTTPKSLCCFTLREVLDFLLDIKGVLPPTLRAEDGCPEVETADAVNWLVSTYDLWRYGLRPGKELTEPSTMLRFRAFSEDILCHLQHLFPGCVICNSAPKSVAFDPCKHVHTCDPCSRPLERCTLCKAKIRTKFPSHVQP